MGYFSAWVIVLNNIFADNTYVGLLLIGFGISEYFSY